MARPVEKISRYELAAYVLPVFLLMLVFWYVLVPSSVELHLTEWLDGCPEGDVRFTCNAGGEYRYFHIYGYIELQKNDFGVGGDDFFTDGGAGSVTLTIGPGHVEPTQMSPAQKAEIERLIQIMPARRGWFWEGYDFDRKIHVAVWKDHELQIYVYDKDDLPDEVNNLLKVFGPNLINAIK